jgi:hypothetical protein
MDNLPREPPGGIVSRHVRRIGNPVMGALAQISCENGSDAQRCPNASLVRCGPTQGVAWRFQATAAHLCRRTAAAAGLHSRGGRDSGPSAAGLTCCTCSRWTGMCRSARSRAIARCIWPTQHEVRVRIGVRLLAPQLANAASGMQRLPIGACWGRAAGLYASRVNEDQV